MENDNQPVYQPAAPVPSRASKGDGKKVFVIILILLSIILIIAGIVYFVSQKNRVVEEATPTPIDYFDTTYVQTPEPTPIVSASPTPSAVEKSKITIQILNGTGTPKEASYVEGILNPLGYTNITAANAATQDYTDTLVVYSSTVSGTVQEEITSAMEKVFKTVKVSSSSTQTVNVKITTGLRSGATAKPSATATPSAKPSATPL
jgi:hypothetical protein